MANEHLAGPWLLVDDKPGEAKSFSDALGGGALPLKVEVLGAKEGRTAILTGSVVPAGLLMDVDLSGETGLLGTGLGIAQDVRAQQKAKTLAEFPIIRFAYPGPVQINVGGDPSSDDLFDDRVEKNEVGRSLDQVQRRMFATSEVYVALSGLSPKDREAGIRSIFGLKEDQLENWIHAGLLSRMEVGLSQGVHVAAGTYIRTCLFSDGLLIDRDLLLMRLGVSPDIDEVRWAAIEKFANGFRYSGVASKQLSRWWARGLDDAWYGLDGVDSPLAMTTIEERCETISRAAGTDLQPLQMPASSLGACPWRWCSLTLETSPMTKIPVDPKYAVRMTPKAEMAPWADPLVASLGAASRVRDPRLNRGDLERLQREHR